MKSSLVDHAVYIRHLVQTDSSAANQERVIGRYSGVPLAVYAHQNKVTIVVDLGWILSSPIPGYRLGSRESVRLGRFH